jgi:hypothetical protein
MQTLLRFLAYFVTAIILFAISMGPLIWFSWAELATSGGGKGSAGSIMLLFLGGLALLFYVVALFSYPFAATGHARIFRLLDLFGLKKWRTGRAAAVLPWLLACLHFVSVPFLFILPLMLFSNETLLVLAATLVVFVGTGVVHHVAIQFARKVFPPPQPSADPAEETLRSLLPWS